MDAWLGHRVLAVFKKELGTYTKIEQVLFTNCSIPYVITDFLC
jgi:hypothetical protein